MKRVRVLVVDDSALVRKTISKLINCDTIEVVGVATDGEDALRRAQLLDPDVVSLDIDMPIMDGMTCLRHLIEIRRQPVVVLSTLALESSFTTFKALAVGAIDFVTKPGSGRYLSNLEELGVELRRKILIAARVPREKIGRRPARTPLPLLHKVPGAAREPSVVPFDQGVRTVIGLGGSTGGAQALEAVLGGLETGLAAAVVAVQHLPPGFSRPFARYLDSLSKFNVKEAQNGEVLKRQSAYIAPGGTHVRLQRTRAGLMLRTDATTNPQAGYRPSIDVLFYSLAAAERQRAVGVLLSGMGEDGVKGLGAVRQFGGRTFVQDRDSSVVYDMAERAVSLGHAEQQIPLDRLADTLSAAVQPTTRQRRGTA